jgi:predicted NAD/FAD-dependent oxidoreductase
MLPCHALMIQFEAELDVDFDAAFVHSTSLSWVANNASKPGRMAGHSWILHSTADWSASHLEAPVEVVRDELLAAFGDATGSAIPTATFFAVHRWLYARSSGGLDGEPLWDPDMKIGACGDWVQGDRVEDAYHSADVLASAILNR